MKVLFIVNPVSGTKSLQKSIPSFIRELDSICGLQELALYKTRHNNDAKEKAASLKKNQFDLVVAVGGDGTVNEVVSGLLESQSDIPLAIIPAGTVNDFGKYLKLPTQPREFAQMIADKQIEPVDIGVINNRTFINVISGGMFSDIGFQVSKEEKNTLGPLAYYLNGLKSLNEEINTQIHLKVTTENETFEEDACLFLLTNSSFVGGFQDITPLASVQDGLLDLMIIKKTDILDLISIFKDYSLFFHNHLDHPSIRYIQAKQFLIESDNDIIYDIDGEKGTSFPINVACKKHAIRMYVKRKEEL